MQCSKYNFGGGFLLYTGIFLGLFGFMAFSYEIYRLFKKPKFDVDFLFFINFWYILSYTLIPFFMAWGGSEYANRYFNFVYSETESVLSLFTIIIGYMALQFGYRVRFGKVKDLIIRPRFSRKTNYLFVFSSDDNITI
jgi:hypothetical protein